MVRRQLFLCTRGSHIIYQLKNKEREFAFFHGRAADGVPAAFLQPLLRRLCGTGRSSHRRWLFPSYLYSRSVSPQLMERRGERMGREHGASPCCGANRIHPCSPPSLPPSHRKELVTKNTTGISLAMQHNYVQCSRKLGMGTSILTYLFCRVQHELCCLWKKQMFVTKDTPLLGCFAFM